MAQKQKRNNKRWIFWLVMAVLFVAAAAVCYLVWDGYFRNKSEDNLVKEQSVAKEEKRDKESEKKEEDVKMKEEVAVSKEEIIQYEGDNPNTQDDLTGVITYAGVSGGNLMIRVNIDQYLEDGTCELSLVQNGVVYSDAANIVGSAATATCEGFNVPAGGLGGQYEIIISLSSGEKAGVIKGEVEI